MHHLLRNILISRDRSLHEDVYRVRRPVHWLAGPLQPTLHHGQAWKIDNLQFENISEMIVINFRNDFASIHAIFQRVSNGVPVYTFQQAWI